MMGFSRVWIVGCVSAMSIASLQAQTIQLPRSELFSAGASVRVPDRGAAHLGGVRRSVQRWSRRGVPVAGRLPGIGRLLSNSDYGAGHASNGASVHVTVIDHEALDRAVLAEARRRRTGGSGDLALRPDLAEFSRRVSRGVRSAAASEEGLMSVAEIRHRSTRRHDPRAQEKRQLTRDRSR